MWWYLTVGEALFCIGQCLNSTLFPNQISHGTFWWGGILASGRATKDCKRSKWGRIQFPIHPTTLWLSYPRKCRPFRLFPELLCRIKKKYFFKSDVHLLLHCAPPLQICANFAHNSGGGAPLLKNVQKVLKEGGGAPWECAKLACLVKLYTTPP